MSARLRSLLPVVFSVLLAGCGASRIQGSAYQPPPDIKDALDGLEQATVTSSAADGLPSFVEGILGRVSTAVNADNAASTLAPAMLKIAPVFRLTADNLAYVRLAEDTLGGRHIRYRQMKNGLDVVSGDLILHVDPNGVVYAVNGTARDGHDIDATPVVDGEQALEAVRAEIAAHEPTLGTPRLVYLIASGDVSMHLAWEILIVGSDKETPVRDLLYVDAKNGAIVDRHPLIHTAKHREVYSAQNTWTQPGVHVLSEGAAPVSDTVVMDAYNNTGITHDCYIANFNRDSYNNQGGNLISTVHYGQQYNNAFWDGTQMVYGDGDGDLLYNLAGGLDVTTHELTHGVTEYSAGLVYQNESGALNEAVSDIFGAVCETWHRGSVTADTWKLGEDVYTKNTPGDALRYMDNPTQDGISYDNYPERYRGSQDSGGVHMNSGIANLAFKLLSTGGTHPRGKSNVQVPALGIDKASQIFYRALTTYMTSNTDFAGARAATSQAAKDLYGDEAAAAVQKTWDAVLVPGGTPPAVDAGTRDAAPHGDAAPAVDAAPPTDAGVRDSAPPADAQTDIPVLHSGDSIPNLSGTTGDTRYYKLPLPSGARNLVLTTRGGTGDVDVYMLLGSLPTTSHYTYASEGSSTSESIAAQSPQSGDWYVLLSAYATYSGVTLQVGFEVGTTVDGGTTHDASPTPDSSTGGVDLSGWRLNQASASTVFTFPQGTVVPHGTVIVVGRSATQAAFEQFWGGALPSNARYFNSTNRLPWINGDETFTLRNAVGGVQDGPTYRILQRQDLQRTSASSPAGDASSWTVRPGDPGSSTPGVGGTGGSGAIFISEISDATSYIYEFVEVTVN